MRTPTSVYLRFAGVAALAGAILAFAASFAVPPRYISTALVRMSPRQAQPSVRDPRNPVLEVSNQAALISFEARQLGQVSSEIVSRNTLTDIIHKPTLDLYPQERAQMPLEDVLLQMRKDLQISPEPPLVPCGAGPSLTTRISFAYGNKEMAWAVVQELVSRLASLSVSMNGNQASLWITNWPSDPLPPEQEIVVLDRPSIPNRPVGPNRLLFLAGGLGGGLLLGLIAASALRRPKWTLQMAGFGAAGSALAIGLSFLLPERYTSTATLHFTTAVVPERLYSAVVSVPAAELMQRMIQEVLRRDTLADIIQRPSLDLYPKQRTRDSLEEIVDKMRSRDLAIHPVDPPVGSTVAMSVSFTYPDAEKATMVVRELVTRMESLHLGATHSRDPDPPPGDDGFRESDLPMGTFRDDPPAGRKLTAPALTAKENDPVLRALELHLGENLEVLDPANVPEVADGPGLVTFAAAGIAFGLLAGAPILWFRQRRARPLQGML
jgi:hypothetical protein